MHRIAVAIAALFGVFIALPAWAQSEIVITQAKALAGNVTPGDTAGYPVTLSQSGAYVLGSNLTVPNGQYGIFAGADNIDLDLNGFLITGNGVGTFGVVSNRSEGRIRNGVINRFRYSGIYLRNNAWSIEDMKIVSNGASGIDATGARFISANNSLIASNGGRGVITGNDGSFDDVTISLNGLGGIYCEGDCSIEGSTITNNNNVGAQMTSGILIGNRISSNRSYAVEASRGAGFANNFILDNNTSGQFNQQTVGTVPLHPNVCLGKPC